MESILTSIKKLLGIEAKYEHFDPDIIMHINSVFMDLTQMGLGPAEGFSIEDDLASWTDFVPDTKKLQAVKSYIYLRVRLLFDPPSSAAVIEAMNRDIQRYEWRLNVAAETRSWSSGTTMDDEIIDYNDLINKPRINGQTLVGDFHEQDPNTKPIPVSDIDDIFDS